MEPKLNISWLESRETYREKLFALFDRKLRGSGRPEIQRGADDAASHLRGGGRDLVVWPEFLGLFSALTGERGGSARTAGSLEGAIVSILGTYAPQNAYYGARYPALTSRVPPTRLLTLSLTDTFGRAVLEPFAEMADRYDVYLEAGVVMARDWHVVCVSKASFRRPRLTCDEQNPAKVAQLRDPAEPTRDYAYEATTDKASVMALLFGPDGRLIAKRAKSYLTPVETGPAEGQLGLDQVPGSTSERRSDVRPVRTPVGTLGFVTSKPAWMPDVVQKLDQQHVDLLVQPEFFEGNLVLADGKTWNPDVLLASGYNDVLRQPSFGSMVLSQLVGGVFDFYADHQSQIAVKPRRRGARGGYLVGQPRQPGLVGVAPWVVGDPARRGEPFAARRRRLGEAGRKLAPGSGVKCPDPAVPGACEDGHVESVVWRDVTVARSPRFKRFKGRRGRTRFSRSRPVRRSRRAQRNAAVAMRGRRGVLAFEERRKGRDQILLVRTRDGGRRWSRPMRPTGRRPGATDEWWPAVALNARGRVTVAWVDRSSGSERVYFSRSADGGRRFGPPRAIAPSGGAQWKPALAAGRGRTVHAVWIDERTRHADGGLPQAGVWYSRLPEPARRLDGGTPAPLATKMANAWAPSVAASGNGVLVSWVGFLRYDWDVFSRLSRDGGATFGSKTDVNDTPAADEAIDDSPRAAFAGRTPLVAWTDWRKRDSASLAPHQEYDTYLGTAGARNRRVDPYGRRQLSTFSPSICGLPGGDALVAFQDAGSGQNDVRITRMRRNGKRGRTRRMDDAGRRGGNAWRPQLACARGRVLAAWEDERDGPPQIYAARARVARIR